MSHKPISSTPMLAEQLDVKIKEALQAEAQRVAVSAEAEAALFAEIAEKQSRAENQAQGAKMRLREFWTVRKYSLRFLLSFCLIFCISCVGVFAAGEAGGKGWVSSGGLEPRISNYNKMPDLVQKLNFEPRIIQTFANGYSFANARISQTQGLDENGQRMSYIYKELYVHYIDSESGQTVTLNVDVLPGSFGRGLKEQTRQVGEITLKYMEQPYKFVPVDYVLTNEDWTAMATGSLEISVGSDCVEENLLKSVVWVQNGVKYHLFGYDLTLTDAEMLDMAAELAAQ